MSRMCRGKIRRKNHQFRVALLWRSRYSSGQSWASPPRRRYLNFRDNPSHIFLNPIRIEPSNLLECLPELASFVDINLASLLGVCLPKLFADSQCFNSLDEDSALRCEVGSAVETEVRGEENLIRVKKVGIGVV